MLTEAIENAEIAFKQFEFNVRLLSFCELGHVDQSVFGRDHLTKLPNGNIRFLPGSFSSDESIHRAASINVIMAFSVSVLLR
jgi:hypothetical protein